MGRTNVLIYTDKLHVMKKLYGIEEMYVITNTKIMAISDVVIARDLQMSNWKYREFLRENFNAVTDNDCHPTTTFFETRKDARKAIDWIESMLLMRHLVIEQR